MRYTSRHAATHGRRSASTPVGGAAQPAAGSAAQLPRFLRGAASTEAELAGSARATASAGAGAGAGAAGRPGGGRPLSADLRRDFELDPSLDLSAVRIHEGADADALATQKGARAFTVAQDIYFRAGEFAPQREDGRRLLAHELTHTLQQGQRHAPDLDALDMSTPGDHHESEADVQAEGWLRGERPRVSRAPSGVLQREPDAQAPDAKQGDASKSDKPIKPTANPPTADQAAARKPPLYTSYFDEVVPGVLEGVEASGEVPYERALWLITQSYGEQSPLSVHEDKSVSYPLPSEHHNRLFNEHASVTEDPKTKVKSVVPGQESEGVEIYNLKQNEFLGGKTKSTSSPTFGYDTTARSTEHHIKLLKERRSGAYDALTKGASFDGFVDAMKASGYATDPNYATKLKGLQKQVSSQVGAWLKYRVPEMRERIGKLEEYKQELNDNLAGWQEKFSDESSNIVEVALQCVKYFFLIVETDTEITRTQTELGRLEKFAGGIKVKLPEAPPQE
ncbi:DUF4157 domain-containing protein [Uliginosibacterium sp. H3]|uniref:DUF4157 domain-containing protein n=1 Tax=Uliginosibacterium silvisoli TaxID=3114758 RepID=A0ABU6K2A3_9RHOO|nr:DUF4157 domain-containing protein [Uliginosibacterium sp. H3]